MQEPNISVGIMAEKEIAFELQGAFKVKDLTVSGKFTVRNSNGKMEISNAESTIMAEEIILQPTDLKTCAFVLKDVTIGIKFHWERKETQSFSGSIKFIPEGDNVRAINILPVESYLTSVISSEMSATSSVQLLKAHAVISRGWLLAQIEKSQQLLDSQQKYKSTYITDNELIKWYDREDHTTFDVCSDDHCQRYQGILKTTTEKVKQAIADTYGLVLMYDNKICDTRFSKSCGGISETFENVWEPIQYPYLASIVDHKNHHEDFEIDLTNEKLATEWIRSSPIAFCNTTDKHILSQVLLDYDQETTDFYRWKVEYSQDQLSKLILEKSGIDYGQIIDLIPIQRGVSGRLIKLKIIGTKKTLIIGKELEIRRTLSKSHLYSSAFVVDKFDIKDNIPQKFVLTGAGWGHGVGLCQIGAAVMGDQGYSYDEILLHYFTGAKLEKLY
jgi:SpoIID/LytB domain protein